VFQEQGRTIMRDTFRKFANFVSRITGSAWAFLLALATILVWGITGPIFGFSDTWQLVINTGTTIITFLMVFLIQNTQNRDAKAIHLKLDELIRAVGKARTELVDLEDLSEDELEKLQDEFQDLHNQYAQHVERVKEEHGRRKKAKAKK
jgi:low affinity Fe/Cu permease